MTLVLYTYNIYTSLLFLCDDGALQDVVVKNRCTDHKKRHSDPTSSSSICSSKNDTIRFLIHMQKIIMCTPYVVNSMLAVSRQAGKIEKGE
jgi:hypothetical protein